MPSKDDGRGGYREPPAARRQVRAPGTDGGVRRIRPTGPEGESRRPASRRPVSRPADRPPAGRPAPQRRPSGRAPTPPPAAAEADGWMRPPRPDRPPQRPASQRPQADPARDALRELARRARRDRRLRRRLSLLATAVCILLAAGAVTAILPDEPAGATPESAQSPAAGLTASLVAPLPYANAGQDGQTAELDWGDVGPARQTAPYAYTAAPAETGALPALGRVDLSWFDDAAFLGDSLTVGFIDYEINVGDALVCAYEGASPNQIVNRTTMADGSVPLDVLAAAAPKKLYVLMGANALAYQTGNDESVLNYYGLMLDELKAVLPDATIFVQSVLPVRADAAAEMPGLTPERVASVNAALQTMAAEKGCYYLALGEALTDDTGYLAAAYAEQDGLHLTVSGYNAWVDYLCTHLPYDSGNPYQVGSDFYLDDEMKALLSDLP